MNKVTLLTLFPESFEFLRTYGVIGKAIENKKLELEIVDMRDFANNKHNHVDDTVYGGAAGMLIRPQVIYDALLSVKKPKSKVAFMSATGKVLDQKAITQYIQDTAWTLAQKRKGYKKNPWFKKGNLKWVKALVKI